MHPLFTNMRRLDARGPASRRIAVDADGAMLGPDCVLVARTTGVYRALDRGHAAALQKFLYGDGGDDPDWLYRQCCRIADALRQGELAFAQICALRIPIVELTDAELAALARAAPFLKANFNVLEPRDWHGRWTDLGGGEGAPHGEGAPSAGDLQAHLIDAGYVLSSEMWRAVRALYRLFMDRGGDFAALVAYIAEHGLNLRELPDVVRSLFDPPQPLAELQTSKPPRGFDSERDLLNYLGPPRPGYEWHHLIEQTGQYRPDLTSSEGIRTWIQNTGNMVQVPVIKHYCISGIMSGAVAPGLRLRSIVKAHSPRAQRSLGIDLLKQCGVIR
jgi:hypothetical protein